MHLFFIFLTSFFISLSEATTCGLALGKGFPARSKRMIIGGTKVDEGVWPWQISLLKHNETEDSWNWAGCGGTLIGDRWALTAAHCFRSGEIVGNYSVLIGSTHASIEEETDQVRSVRNIIRHPTYSVGYAHNDDITLLELEPSPSNSDSIIPVCLSAKIQTIPLGIKGVVTGYGATENEDFNNLYKLTTDEKLRQTKVDIHSVSQCGREHERQYRIRPRGTNLGICTGDPEHGTQKGDSGGPLMMKASDGRWVQIGISSYSLYKRLENPRIDSTTESVPINPDEEASGDKSVEEGSGESQKNIEEGSGEVLSNATEFSINDYKKQERREDTTYVRNRSSFTKVYRYCDWIEKETKGEVKCLEGKLTFEEPPNFSDSTGDDVLPW